MTDVTDHRRSRNEGDSTELSPILKKKTWIQENIMRRSDDGIGTEPTDAFGEIEFQGFGEKIGKYVRVDDRTDVNVIIKLLTKEWGLKLPKMLISVTGGAKNFQIKPRLKEVFRRGLVKLAKSTGAWVTTCGTNTGVMKHVGEAIRDYGFTPPWQDKVIAIGIAPWGCIENREALIDKEGRWPASYQIGQDDTGKEGTYLDPNHSHFILVDSGVDYEFGKEIGFRARLEKRIAEEKIKGTNTSIPTVVVVVGGGIGTMETVRDSLEHDIPVIIIKASGRAADIMAFGYKHAVKEGDLRKKIEKEFAKELSQEDQDKVMEFVRTSLKKLHLITIFEMDNENSACDIDVAVLKAHLKILNGEDKKLENLRLTMEWKRIDVAKTEIFTDDSKWSTGTLDELMILALQRNQVDFVKIFLDYGVNLKTILTKEKLQNLYEPIKEELKVLIKKYTQENETCGNSSRSYKSPDQELFLWSLLKNNKEMAFLFWKLLREPLPAALVANKLLKEMVKFTDNFDERNKLQEHAVLFEERAVGILNAYYDANDDIICQLLDLQRDNWGKTSCILMAIGAKNKNFISHPASQSLLNNIWMGKLHNKTKQWKLPFLYIFPLFFWLITFKNENVTNNLGSDPQQTPLLSDPGVQTDDKRGKERNDLSWWEKFQAFYTAPVNIFIGNVLSYCVTLFIFSYVLMIELDEHISGCEIFLYIWVISVFLEEIRQLCNKETNSIKGKFKAYFQNYWNIIDVINIVLFLIGIGIRHTVELENARIILALNLCTFYARSLHIFSVHPKLGPKLVMIWDMMMKDLTYFMMILFVFVTAYGVATQAILYPNSQESFYELFKRIFKKPYFQMYGELFLDEIEVECTGNKTCPSETAREVVPVLMAVYILLTNVLLLNLLIAMFSKTFQDIQVNAGQYWRVQRLELITEYCLRPALPPPFIIINHVCWFIKKTFCKNIKTDEKHKAFNKEREIHDDLLLSENYMWDRYLMNEEKSNSSRVEEKVSRTSDRLFDRTKEMMNQIQDLRSTSEQNEKRMEQMMSDVTSRMSDVTSGMSEMEKQIKEMKQMLLTLKSSDKETE